MDAMECLLTRRSVRRFLPNKPIAKELLSEVIKAAQYAPSAHNKQPWEFVVVEDKKFLADLHQHQPWTVFAKDAAAAIIVCSNASEAFSNEAEGWNFADIDCALATENLLLAAHALGLGATVCAAAPIKHIVEQLQSLLGLPQNIHPMSIVIMGHPEGEVKQPSSRFDEEKIHWGKW